MEQLRKWAALAAIVLLGSCTAEKQPLNQDVELPEVVKRTVVLSAYSSDDSGTKSSRDDEGHFFWSPGDDISVFYGSGTQGGDRFVYSGTEQTAVAEFTGTMEEKEVEGLQYWAIYPYNALNSCDGEKLVTEIPSRQIAAEETFADGQFISIGHSDTQSIGFYHLCGGIKFFLATEGVTQITLQGNKSQPLAGVVEVTVDENNHPVISKIREPRYEIVLTPPEGENAFKTGTNYFFVTMPADFDTGFNVVLYKGDTKEAGARLITPNGGMEIHRAKFQWSTLAIDTGVSFSSPEECDIEQTRVRNYLEEVDYTADTDYTYSAVFGNNSYISNTAHYDFPTSAKVTWSGNGASKVRVSTSPSFDGKVLEVSASSKSADIYNLIPGVVYFYKVVKSDGTSIKEGSLIPVGPMRMIRFPHTSSSYPSISNVRDLGGWRAGDKTIRYGKLFRGAAIDNITSSGYSDDLDLFLNTLGIGLAVDLRGHEGSSGTPVELTFDSDKCSWANYPIYKLLGVATGETSEIYRACLKRIIYHLRDNGKPVYFYCKAGADRTGTVAFLIEALLGVSESDLAKDFELTTFGVTNKRYRHVSASDDQFTSDQKKYPYKDMIMYLRDTYQGATMQEKVTAWATTGENALTSAEIEELKALLLE